MTGGVEKRWWSKTRRARHEAGLKEMVWSCAVEEARCLERAAHRRAGVRRSWWRWPVHALGTCAWGKLMCLAPWLPGVAHGLRLVPQVAGPGMSDRLLCDVGRLRRQVACRGAHPSPGMIDTQTVTCIPVRSPRGYDVAKKLLGRSFGWIGHWNGRLRDHAGWLDASAARIAFVAVLAGVEALVNAMPIQAVAR